MALQTLICCFSHESYNYYTDTEQMQNNYNNLNFQLVYFNSCYQAGSLLGALSHQKTKQEETSGDHAWDQISLILTNHESEDYDSVDYDSVLESQESRDNS